VLSAEDLESLEETVNVLSDERLVGDIHEAMGELAAGPATTLTKDEATALVAKP
jgi:PHD/YefM family antitoxin component YafN of YafNO toxin-antitoxin module